MKPLWWLLVLGCLISIAPTASADCTVEYNCQQSCPGTFWTVRCQCHQPPQGPNCNCKSPSCGSCGWCCLGQVSESNCTTVKCYGGQTCNLGGGFAPPRAGSAASVPLASVHSEDDPLADIQQTEGSGSNRWPADVDVQIPSNTPLTLAGLRVVDKGDKVSDFTYSIRNDGNTSLIAYQLDWELSSADGTPGPGATQVWDTWGSRSDGIVPGATREQRSLHLGFSSRGRFGRIVAHLVYAEFADGTIVGTVPESLQSRRSEWIKVYNDLSSVYATRGEKALREAVTNGASAPSSAFGRQPAYQDALEVLQSQGIPGFTSRATSIQRAAARRP